MSPGDVTAAGRGAAGISGVPRPPANGEGQGGIRSVHGGASDAYRFVIIIPELDPRPAVHLSVTMTTTYGFGFDDFARPRSRGARIARIDALATLLDTALVIPGTGAASRRIAGMPTHGYDAMREAAMAVALEVVALTLRDRRSRARTSGRRRKSSDLGIGKCAGEHQSPKADTGSPVSVGTVCEILSVRVRAHRQTHREHRALARLARHGPRRRPSCARACG